MAITSICGVTSFSDVNNIADSNINSINGVAIGGGGGATLIEGFESFTNNGNGTFTTTRLWNELGAAFVIPSQSTSNVTQGTFSLQLVCGIDATGAEFANFEDLSAYTTFELDVKPSGLSLTSTNFQITDGTNTASASSSLGVATAATLTLQPLSSGVNLSACKVRIRSIDILDSGQTIYADNLRAAP